MATIIKNANDIKNYKPSKEELKAYEFYKKAKNEDISDIPELIIEQLILAVQVREIRKNLSKFE